MKNDSGLQVLISAKMGRVGRSAAGRDWKVVLEEEVNAYQLIATTSYRKDFLVFWRIPPVKQTAGRRVSIRIAYVTNNNI